MRRACRFQSRWNWATYAPTRLRLPRALVLVGCSFSTAFAEVFALWSPINWNTREYGVSFGAMRYFCAGA
jgi:hypothetical protein